MAKRPTKKTTPAPEPTDLEKFEIQQTKISNELLKNSTSFQRMLETQAKTIQENVDRLEEIRFDYSLEQARMAQERDAHKLSMEQLEAETRENAEEILENAETSAKQVMETATAERDRVISEKKEAIKRLESDFEYKKTQEERIYKEFVLGNKEAALAQLLPEFNLARISNEKLEELQGRLESAETNMNAEINKAVNAQVSNLNKDHQMKVVELTSSHAQELAETKAEVKAKDLEITALKTQVENYKQLLDNHQKNQVEIAKYSRSDIHFSNDGGGKK